jgi:hypothetical protein
LDRIKQVKEVEATTKGDLSWVTSPPGSWNGNVELESPIVHGNIHGCNRRFIPKKKTVVGIQTLRQVWLTAEAMARDPRALHQN